VKKTKLIKVFPDDFYADARLRFQEKEQQEAEMKDVELIVEAESPDMAELVMDGDTGRSHR
jgi:hypothetical protein